MENDFLATRWKAHALEYRRQVEAKNTVAVPVPQTTFPIGLTESDTGKRRFGHKVGLMEIPLVSPSSLPRQKIFILLLLSMLIIVYNL